MSTGLGIKAFECVDGAPDGYQFSVLEPPETPVREAFAELMEKIVTGIAVRYLEPFLSSFTGFDFRLECFDASANREISAAPERPDPLWWLDDAEPVDPDDRSHH